MHVSNTDLELPTSDLQSITSNQSDASQRCYWSLTSDTEKWVCWFLIFLFPHHQNMYVGSFCSQYSWPRYWSQTLESVPWCHAEAAHCSSGTVQCTDLILLYPKYVTKKVPLPFTKSILWRQLIRALQERRIHDVPIKQMAKLIKNKYITKLTQDIKVCFFTI